MQGQQLDDLIVQSGLTQEEAVAVLMKYVKGGICTGTKEPISAYPDLWALGEPDKYAPWRAANPLPGPSGSAAKGGKAAKGKGAAKAKGGGSSKKCVGASLGAVCGAGLRSLRRDLGHCNGG